MKSKDGNVEYILRNSNKKKNFSLGAGEHKNESNDIKNFEEVKNQDSFEKDIFDQNTPQSYTSVFKTNNNIVLRKSKSSKGFPFNPTKNNDYFLSPNINKNRKRL
jgi:hypothetical protein